MAIINIINSPSTFIRRGWLVNKLFTNFGYIEDNYDERDISITRSPLMSNSLVNNPTVKQFFKEISDQQQLSSCVGNSSVDMTEALIIKRKNIAPSQMENLSRLFVYYNARNNENPPATNKDDGTKIRLAMDAISRYGVPSENMWAYDLNNVNKQPTISTYRAALSNRIYGYYRIDGSGEDRWGQIKTALSGGSGVVFGMKIAKNFQQPAEVIQLPTTSILGGHAIVIVTMDETPGNEKVLIRNSWGTSWGKEGYNWVSKEYILSSLCSDFWTATV